MALPWVRGRNREIAEAIQKLLTRNEWYTLEELIALSGGEHNICSVALAILNREYGALRVNAPCEDTHILWHGPAPDTIRMGRDADGFMELPWELKKSYVKKYNALHERGTFKWPLRETVAAHMAANKHLSRIGLLQEHPRPDNGFIYPRMWRADMPSLRNERSLGSRPYTVFLEFVGRIPTAAFPPYAECAQSHSFGYMAPVCPGIGANKNMTRIEAYVGWASVLNTTLKIVECTPKKKLLMDTRKTLRMRVEEFSLTAPFAPVRCKFKLLSKSTKGNKKPVSDS